MREQAGQPQWRVDNITSLACLQECYEKCKNRIVFAEKSDDTVALLHMDLRDFFSSIPDKLVTRTSFEELKDQGQSELANQIETVWKKLRKIISVSFYHNDG